MPETATIRLEITTKQATHESTAPPSPIRLAKQHIESNHPVRHSSKLPNMPDDNLAIILTLFLLFIVIGVGAWFGRKWIKAFTTAMVQAKQAERENAV